ncbi:dnaJ homolog subfamily C member 27-like [Hyalella azteca]|uniref:DnaJ homolog subfamily C member 27-like n=1 Tax=Hyalella azteca TaxID=294128 RepID=A0A979FKW3_HYAAZ|nr:dnaJ homolog subfamily C member 27-like [Hyalella azteca]
MDYASSRSKKSRPRMPTQPENLPRIRVLSLGNEGVGKSCLIKRYCEQRFVARYIPTIGIDYGSTRVEVDDQVVSVHFFDTSGSPLFEEVRSEFYADMQGVLLVYDVTDQASFLALDSWMAELHHNLGQSGVSTLEVVVVGNRSDTGGRPAGRQSLFSAALHGKENIRKSPTPSNQQNTGTKNGFNSTKNGSNRTKNCSNCTKNGSNGTKNGCTASGGGADAGGIPPTPNKRTTTAGSETEAEAAIGRLLSSSDHFHKLQLNRRGTTKEDVNKSYRRLAALVHPDKCAAPGAEEAFKRLAQARAAALSYLTETTV